MIKIQKPQPYSGLDKIRNIDKIYTEFNKVITHEVSKSFCMMYSINWSLGTGLAACGGGASGRGGAKVFKVAPAAGLSEVVDSFEPACVGVSREMFSVQEGVGMEGGDSGSSFTATVEMWVF